MCYVLAFLYASVYVCLRIRTEIKDNRSLGELNLFAKETVVSGIICEVLNFSFKMS